MMMIPTTNTIIVDAKALYTSKLSLDFSQSKRFCSITPSETIDIVAEAGDSPNISILELHEKYQSTLVIIHTSIL